MKNFIKIIFAWFIITCFNTIVLSNNLDFKTLITPNLQDSSKISYFKLLSYYNNYYLFHSNGYYFSEDGNSWTNKTLDFFNNHDQYSHIQDVVKYNNNIYILAYANDNYEEDWEYYGYYLINYNSFPMQQIAAEKFSLIRTEQKTPAYQSKLGIAQIDNSLTIFNYSPKNSKAINYINLAASKELSETNSKLKYLKNLPYFLSYFNNKLINLHHEDNNNILKLELGNDIATLDTWERVRLRPAVHKQLFNQAFVNNNYFILSYGSKIILSQDFITWKTLDLNNYAYKYNLNKIITDLNIHQNQYLDILLFDNMNKYTDLIRFNISTGESQLMNHFTGKVEHLAYIDNKYYISGDFYNNFDNKLAILAYCDLD